MPTDKLLSGHRRFKKRLEDEREVLVKLAEEGQEPKVFRIRTFDCVREAAEAGQLTLHAWLYDLYTGDLLAYDGESGDWGPLVLPEEGS